MMECHAPFSRDPSILDVTRETHSMPSRESELLSTDPGPCVWGEEEHTRGVEKRGEERRGEALSQRH